jgi:hypothetical protein
LGSVGLVGSSCEIAISGKMPERCLRVIEERRYLNSAGPA